MATDTLDEELHATAIKAVLDAALVGGTKQWHTYDYDDVPSTLPSNYAAITVTRRFGDDFRFARERKLVGYRLTTLAVGLTVGQARWVRRQIAQTLSDKRLTIDGRVTTQVRFEAENPIEPDDGRYSGQTSWTYAV